MRYDVGLSKNRCHHNNFAKSSGDRGGGRRGEMEGGEEREREGKRGDKEKRERHT